MAGDGPRVRAIIEAGAARYRREAMADTPQFLYRITPKRADMLATGLTEHEMQVMTTHFAHLQKLAADGVVLMAGRTLVTGPETFGIVVFRAASQDEAEAVMRSDPAIAQGVMHCELFPYRVAVWADGFRLGA